MNLFFRDGTYPIPNLLLASEKFEISFLGPVEMEFNGAAYSIASDGAAPYREVLIEGTLDSKDLVDFLNCEGDYAGNWSTDPDASRSYAIDGLLCESGQPLSYDYTVLYTLANFRVWEFGIVGSEFTLTGGCNIWKGDPLAGDGEPFFGDSFNFDPVCSCSLVGLMGGCTCGAMEAEMRAKGLFKNPVTKLYFRGGR